MSLFLTLTQVHIFHRSTNSSPSLLIYEWVSHSNIWRPKFIFIQFQVQEILLTFQLFVFALQEPAPNDIRVMSSLLQYTPDSGCSWWNLCLLTLNHHIVQVIKIYGIPVKYCWHQHKLEAVLEIENVKISCRTTHNRLTVLFVIVALVRKDTWENLITIDVAILDNQQWQ